MKGEEDSDTTLRDDCKKSLLLFNRFSDRLEIAKLYPAAMTYANHIMFGCMQEDDNLQVVLNEMRECILDGLAQVKVLLQISPKEERQIYSQRVEAWPPFHNHPKDFCEALEPSSEEPYRGSLTNRGTVYVPTKKVFESLVGSLLTGLLIYLKRKR